MRLNIDLIGDRRVVDRLLAFRRAAQDMSPVMASIGELLINSTRARFDAEISPDGKAWAPLATSTLRRKTRNTDKVLTERGYLRASIAYRAATDYVDVGSPIVYASTHQFGAAKGTFGTSSRGPIPWGDIPARPFLGFSPGDLADIRTEILDFLSWPHPT